VAGSPESRGAAGGGGSGGGGSQICGGLGNAGAGFAEGELGMGIGGGGGGGRELGWLGLPGWLVSLFYFFFSVSKIGSLVIEKVL